MLRAKKQLLVVVVMALCLLARTECPSTVGATLFSSLNLKDGDIYNVPAGQTVVYDLDSSPLLRGITVEGTLIFSDEKDLSLDTQYLIVLSGGNLYIGDECCPYEHNLQITLRHPANTSESLYGIGTKVFGAVAGAYVSIYAKLDGPSWTTLAQTANVGATTVVLNETVEWQVGHKIILTSTDFTQTQAETVTITAVNNNEVSFTPALTYMHYADDRMRGEVALVNRRVVIRGDNASIDSQFGGHVMFMGEVRGVTVHGIEVYNMGQRPLFGRYPMHFHFGMDLTGRAALKDLSIHDNFQRCIVVHATHGVEVWRNVAYNTFGHCFFVEDGIETGNTFAYNLGFLVKAVTSSTGLQLLPTDNLAATYWITNPNNTIIHNVAAGSEGHCFWYAFPKTPTGPSKNLDPNSIPYRTQLAKSAYNVAHSCGVDGLHVDGGPDVNTLQQSVIAYDPVLYPVPIKDEFNNTVPDTPVQAVFEAFSFWKNKNRGVWLRAGFVALKHSFFADNLIGVTFAINNRIGLVTECEFVGESPNLGNPGTSPKGLDGRSLPVPSDPSFPIRGVEFYDGPIRFWNNRFSNFIPNALRNASSVSMLRKDQFSIANSNSAADLVFQDASTRVSFPDFQHDGDHSSTFIDLTGSISGRPPTTTARAAFANRSPFLTTENCLPYNDGTLQLCPDHFSTLYMNFGGLVYYPPDITHMYEIARADQLSAVQQVCGGFCPTSTKIAAGTPPTSMWMGVALNRQYYINFKTSPPTTLLARMNYANRLRRGSGLVNELRLGFCYPVGTTITSLQINSRTSPTQAASLAALWAVDINSTVADGLWYQDTTTGYIWVRLYSPTVRTADNEFDAFPSGQINLGVDLPVGWNNKTATCSKTAVAAPFADDPLPPIGTVPTPAAWSEMPPVTPRNNELVCGVYPPGTGPAATTPSTTSPAANPVSGPQTSGTSSVRLIGKSGLFLLVAFVLFLLL